MARSSPDGVELARLQWPSGRSVARRLIAPSPPTRGPPSGDSGTLRAAQRLVVPLGGRRCRSGRIAQREVAGGQVAVPKRRSGGSSSAQISCAYGQRVRKRQPDGGVIADGSSPVTAAPRRERASTGSGTGIVSIRPRV